MIAGNGDIAHALSKALRPADEGYVFFASGVSNSQESRESEFEREKALLLDQDPKKHLVYFSSLSIFYANNAYQVHKRDMEWTVRFIFKHYTIVRLGNIDWGNNPHTIINALRAQVKRGEKPIIQDVYRYIVSEPEFLHWIDLIPDWNCEMNISGRMMKVQQILEEFVYG